MNRSALFALACCCFLGLSAQNGPTGPNIRLADGPMVTGNGIPVAPIGAQAAALRSQVMDSNGNLWGIGDQGGRSCLVEQEANGAIRYFTPENSGLLAGVLSLQLGHGNTVWIQTDDFTLQTFDGQDWSTYVLEARIVRFVPSRNVAATAWAVTDDHQLYQWEEGLLIHHNPLLDELRADTKIQTVFADAQGAVWAFAQKGYFRYEGGFWTADPSSPHFPVAELGSPVAMNTAGMLVFEEQGRQRLIGFDPVRKKIVAAF
jgi:hypothetical protein